MLHILMLVKLVHTVCTAQYCKVE